MRKEIGTVTISSGLFYIVDPCYIKGFSQLHKPDFNQEAFEKLSGGEKYDSLFGGVMGKIPIGTHSVFSHFGQDPDMGDAIEKLEIFVEKNDNEKTKTVELGRIGVDAGLVYFADARKISEHSLLCNGEKWQDFCDNYYAKSDSDKKSFVLMCDGIICNTYHGDGEYAVIAETDMKGRIKKIEINFLDAGWSGF